MSAKSSVLGRARVVAVLALATTWLVGCFNHPDDKVSQMVCTSSNNCPNGYSCVKQAGSATGSCRRPGNVADTGGGGGLPSADGSGSGGAVGTKDGGAADIPLLSIDGASAELSAPTVDSAAVNGAKSGSACTVSSDCPSGFCADGICCDSACTDTCYSCAQLYTGKPDGTCTAVGAGKKGPHAECADETDTNQCGGDGTCDGAGACRKAGTDHVCTTASCNASTFTPTSTCDGKGACKTVTAQDCGGATCDVVDGCRTACATEKDCPSTSYCNITTKRCSARKIDGDSCTAATECTSGFCADGVCCNIPCTGKCMACSATLTTGKSGLCSAVNVGTDPHDSCTIDTTNECGADGTCDGAGACRMTGTDHVCKTSSCNGGTFTRTATCDGKGACGTATSENCGAFTCSVSIGCQRSCTVDTDCSAQSYCDTTTKACTAKKDNGSLCAAARECTSANCVDGMCCNSKCDGPCSSCQKAHTNGTDGTCAAVAQGQDPYNSCQDETGTNKCGSTGMCDGAGACQKADKTKSCGSASCGTSGGSSTFTPASMCDGLGNCKTGSLSNCGVFQCSATTGCLTTCVGDGDCSSTTYCDLSLAKPVCTTKLGLGSSCGTDGNKCASSRCVDGVCCNTDCSASCYACNVKGSAGSCSPVANGTADPKGACKASGSTCGQDGTCSTGGVCHVAPAGTTGTDCATSCSNSTLTQRSCDGKGSCTSSSSPCGSNLVCASAAACKTSCTADKDCTVGMLCTADGTHRCAPICLYDDPGSLFNDVCVLGP